MGALAPFLCLVRTFRVGFHSALRSKGPKYDIRPLGISPPRPAVKTIPQPAALCRFLPHTAAFLITLPPPSSHCRLPHHSAASLLSLSYYYFSSKRKYFIRER